MANVSNRVIARKLPSPSPVIPFCFCSCPNLLDELASKRLICRLTKKQCPPAAKNSHTFPFNGTIEELNLVVRLNFSPSKKFAVDVPCVESVYQPCSIIVVTLTADIVYLTKFT